ncbi:hypothetical protein V5799_008840 [Amblyomma americanum]|uniref:Cytochrome n=1 Tax=Amblyomma americanum TaxID=6943 RepID=A0AAQ4FDL0_AMBAM
MSERPAAAIYPQDLVVHPLYLTSSFASAVLSKTSSDTMEADSDSILMSWDWRCVVSLVAAAAFLVRVAFFYHKVAKYPRGPFPLPFLGNLLTLARVRFLHRKADEWSAVYGDVFTLWLGEKPMVFLNSHSAIHEAFVVCKNDCAGRLDTKLGLLQTGGVHDVFFEDYNAHWKALRKVASAALRKFSVSDLLPRDCVNAVDAFVDSLRDKPEVMELKSPFSAILFNQVGASTFGTSSQFESNEIRHLRELNDDFYKLAPNGLPSDVAPWLGIIHAKTERKVKTVMAEFRTVMGRLFEFANGCYPPENPENITHALIAEAEGASKENPENAMYLAKSNIHQIAVDIFTNATNATMGQLQWFFLIIMKSPDIQDKIQKEIESAVGTKRPAPEDMQRLPFTVACILETLRRHPVVPLGVPHKSLARIRIGAANIPNNTGILYNLYAANHDPGLWEEPHRFRPERFLDPVTGQLLQDVGPFLTFGLGARMCPGKKMAQMSMFYIVVRLMQRLSCRAPAGSLGVSFDAFDSSLFLVPAPQRILFVKRS